MLTNLPKLKVLTRPLPALPDLLQLTDKHDPLVWLRDGFGIACRGEALRLHFQGATRFADAAKTWRKIAALAEVEDQVNEQGTGLVALASFTFDAASKEESLIVVPKIIFGNGAGGAWVTTITATDEVLTAQDIAALLENIEPFGAAPSTSFIELAGEASAYREGVLEASRRIGDAKAEKIVLARRLQAKIAADSDLRVPLAALANRYDDCWTFAVAGMIGASPETLIRSISGEVTARVLAGTRKRYVDAERDEAMREELKNSKKEQFEHRLAVESLVETLSPYVSGLRAEGDPHLLKLPNVWHLATDVAAELKGEASVLELAGAVHPTAAVAGTPTPVAVATIAELEPFDRGRYAGAIGWIDANGNGDFAIALRCAQVQDAGVERTVTAFAGGGLVAGSDPWHELTETVAKFRPIIEAFS